MAKVTLKTRRRRRNCAGCGRELKVAAFRLDPSSPDGLAVLCIDCQDDDPPLSWGGGDPDAVSADTDLEDAGKEL